VLKAPTDVVERLAMAVVESPAICLGLSAEMVIDICPSESTFCHSSPTEVSLIANVGSTPTRRDVHTQKLITADNCGDRPQRRFALVKKLVWSATD
jgi:hypothetical protein